MSRPNSKIVRIVTVALGAIPTLVWLPLLAIWMPLALGAFIGSVSGPFEYMPPTFALVAAGFLGIWGIYAIWETALGPLPIEKPTARGIAAGVVSMVIMIWALMSLSSDEGGSMGVPGLIPLWLAFGPIAVAAWHLYGFVTRDAD